MIDFVEAEKYLDARRNKKHFIPEADSKFKLKKEDIKNIKRLQLKFGNGEVEKIFSPSTIQGARFIVEAECSSCQKYHDKIMSKTSLFEYLKTDDSNKKPLFMTNLCSECFENNQKILRHKKTPEEIHEEKSANTAWFVDNFLNPERQWDEGMKSWEKLQTLQNYQFSIHHEIVKKRIKSMNYKDFLKTPYWKAIAEKKMKQSDFKCQLCNENGKLNVHHRTYSIHGDEINNMKDLIVLCEPCHCKFHEK